MPPTDGTLRPAHASQWGVVLFCTAWLLLLQTMLSPRARAGTGIRRTGLYWRDGGWTIEQCASLLPTTVRVRILDDDDDDGTHSESILCCTYEICPWPARQSWPWLRSAHLHATRLVRRSRWAARVPSISSYVRTQRKASATASVAVPAGWNA